MKKIKLSKNQQKIIAEIFEKIALGVGATTLIKGVIFIDTDVSTYKMWILGITSLALLAASIILRREA